MNFTIKQQSDFEQLFFLRKYLVGHNGFIAGGCFKDIFTNKEVRDIDIFFRSSEDASAAVVAYETNTEYRLLYENRNATGFTEIATGRTIELVRARFGLPVDVLSQFDFSICKFSMQLELWHDKLLTNPKEIYECTYSTEFFTDLARGRLNFDGDILHAGFTLERTIKYAKYGFKIDKANISLLTETIFNQGRTKVVEEINSSEKGEGY